jgi:hypothetical protein
LNNEIDRAAQALAPRAAPQFNFIGVSNNKFNPCLIYPQRNACFARRLILKQPL